MVGDAEVQAMLADIRAQTAALDSQTKDLRALRKAEREKYSDVEKDTAEKRRNGDFGPDWRKLQQRIDMHQTTYDDIISGVDKSDEARAVRKLMQTDIVPRVKEQFAAALNDDANAADVEAFKQAQQHLTETLADADKPDGTA